MRIIGIDPGLTRCGIGIIDMDSQRRAQLVHVEVARSPQNMASHFRLDKIRRRIAAAIEQHQPEVMSIERVFAQDNVQSVTSTMWVMGIAMSEAAAHKLPLAIHTPSEVKAAVTGAGVADKAQVQHMVQRILRMEKVVRPADAADALAIAICHGWRRDGLQAASRDGTVNVSLSGKISARGALTPAQKLWAQAQAATRRTGAVDPRLRRNKSK